MHTPLIVYRAPLTYIPHILIHAVLMTCWYRPLSSSHPMPPPITSIRIIAYVYMPPNTCWLHVVAYAPYKVPSHLHSCQCIYGTHQSCCKYTWMHPWRVSTPCYLPDTLSSMLVTVYLQPTTCAGAAPPPLAYPAPLSLYVPPDWLQMLLMVLQHHQLLQSLVVIGICVYYVPVDLVMCSTQGQRHKYIHADHSWMIISLSRGAYRWQPTGFYGDSVCSLRCFPSRQAGRSFLSNILQH